MILVRGPREEVRQTIENWSPDFIILNNSDIFSNFFRDDAEELMSYFGGLSTPIAMWDYEGPTFSGGSSLVFKYLDNKFLKNILYFAVDSEVALDYKRRGFTSFYLPFGVDPRLAQYRVPAHLKNSFQHDMVYIGTAPAAPIFPEVVDLQPSVLQYYTDMIDFDIRSIMARVIKDTTAKQHLDRVHATIKPQLEALLKADIEDSYVYHDIENKFSKAYVTLLIQEMPQLASTKHQLEVIVGLRLRLGYSVYQLTNRLDHLIPEGIRVYGEGEWNRILLNYAHPVRRLSYPEMFAAFHNSKIVFSYTKKLFLTCVHERVFHVLGAGGCPLMDHRADLELVFEKDDIPAYRSMEELDQLTKFLLKNDSARLQMVERGRNKVFSAHTYVHRLADLLWAVCKETSTAMPSLQVMSFTGNQEWIEAMAHPPKVPTKTDAHLE